MHSSVFSVGEPVPLNGIYTRAAVERCAGTMVLLLNSGLLHHVGSCCLSVRFAHRLAAAGISSGRFDFSGIGDSLPRVTDQSYLERMDAEIREVMDYFTDNHGVRRFILYGLCSGAFAAVTRGTQDERVIGLVQIAPQTFRTVSWYWHHYTAKVRRVALYAFSRPARIDVARRRRQAIGGQLEQWGGSDDELASLAELRVAYEQMLARNAPLFVLSTEGELDTYNHLGQFRSMFPGLDFGDSLIEHFFPTTRHIITEPDDQRRILELMTDWVSEQVERLGPSVEGRQTASEPLHDAPMDDAV